MQKLMKTRFGAGSNPVVVFFQNNMGILIALLALCAVLSIATDSFLTANNLLTVLRQICINAFLCDRHDLCADYRRD